MRTCSPAGPWHASHAIPSSALRVSKRPSSGRIPGSVPTEWHWEQVPFHGVAPCTEVSGGRRKESWFGIHLPSGISQTQGIWTSAPLSGPSGPSRPAGLRIQ